MLLVFENLLAYEIVKMWAVRHGHQAKVLMYPQNKNFLSLQLITLRSQRIFSFRGYFVLLA
ncbi:hypothetical protein CN686_27200 [Bacillus pseudomycoides]|nr:hypothetical protein CN686_27200 [Bacillus pseudomycoides]